MYATHQPNYSRRNVRIIINRLVPWSTSSCPSLFRALEQRCSALWASLTWTTTSKRSNRPCWLASCPAWGWLVLSWATVWPECASDVTSTWARKPLWNRRIRPGSELGGSVLLSNQIGPRSTITWKSDACFQDFWWSASRNYRRSGYWPSFHDVCHRAVKQSKQAKKSFCRPRKNLSAPWKVLTIKHTKLITQMLNISL